MATTATTKKVFLWIAMAVMGMASAAHARTCYQGRGQVYNSAQGKWRPATLTLGWSDGRADELDSLKVSSPNLNAETVLFCSGASPTICTLEGDGGRMMMLFSRDSLNVTADGQLQISADDSGKYSRVSVEKVVSKVRENVLLKKVAPGFCRKAFPHSSKIIIEDPPGYDD